VSLAVAHGLGNAQKVVEMMKSGKKAYHFVEVMTCPAAASAAADNRGLPRTRNVLPASALFTRRMRARNSGNRMKTEGQADLREF